MALNIYTAIILFKTFQICNRIFSCRSKYQYVLDNISNGYKWNEESTCVIRVINRKMSKKIYVLKHKI